MKHDRDLGRFCVSAEHFAEPEPVGSGHVHVEDEQLGEVAGADQLRSFLGTPGSGT
jgi:hypothetical protein